MNPSTAQLREILLSMLEDEPMPWATPTLQAAFSPRHHQRIGIQLTRLECQQKLARYRPTSSMMNWWSLPVPRQCMNCGGQHSPDSIEWVAGAIAAGVGREYLEGSGGWACKKDQQCRMAVWAATYRMTAYSLAPA